VDEAEASAILNDTVSRLRTLSHTELTQKQSAGVDAYEVPGASGARYQIEVEAFWDDPRRKGGNVRVIVSIDDGKGWRSISPMTTSFIVAPDGSFVGE
jgi:hypothetical protein